MLCWARQLFILMVVLLGIGQMMAACGQKGPLFLPEEPAGQRQAPSGSPAPSPQPDQAPEIPGPEAVPPPVR
ncbi:MAG: lipoprotein [Chromatiaceae bacterium]|nr:lipoprotein [Chromatiaceae bacterium]